MTTRTLAETYRRMWLRMSAVAIAVAWWTFGLPAWHWMLAFVLASLLCSLLVLAIPYRIERKHRCPTE